MSGIAEAVHVGGFVLEARGIEKRFGPTHVLRKTDLCVRPGEIHALLGGNGAGKSTLIRIISGVLRADAGTVRVAGSETFADTDIAVVFQELALLPHLTVAENISLPHRRRGLGLYRQGDAEREASAALAMIDVHLPHDGLARPVGALDLHQRQLVEIARALSSGACLLLLDEPTANLTFAESERLFVVLRRLARQQGISTILVSHRMAEIRAVADVCTILRDGSTVVDRQPLERFGDDAIVAAMGQTRAAATMRPRAHRATDRTTLSLVHGRQRADLAPGDVLGLAGAPEGPTDLMNGLLGAVPSQHWTITLDGHPLRLRRPADAVRLGIGYVSGDRAEKGILASLPILDNIVAGARVSRRRVLALGDELRQANAALQRLSIKASSVDALPRTLSGGTQQKLLLARWLDTAPRILVLEEPTRGVDIGTKRDIYALIRQIADAGGIVIWWSTEFSELAEICGLALAFDLDGEPSRLLNRDEITEHHLAQATGIAA